MIKKVLLTFFLILSFLTMIATCTAADYYVNDTTTHGDIVNWMKNNAKNGDNLIFTGNSYNLTNPLIVSKSINIKSENKTQINFNKKANTFEESLNAMFEVTASSVNFDGLSLNYNSNGYGVIKASKTLKTINIKNTDITANGHDLMAISIDKWQGNITNSKIHINGKNSFGIESTNWVGNLVRSKIICEKVTGDVIGRAIAIVKWRGNIANSEISSHFGHSVYAIDWSGKIYGSKIYDYNTEKGSVAIFFAESKGTITNSIIKSSGGSAIGVSDDVKVSKSSLSSGKNFPKIERYRPDLVIDSVKKSGNSYSVSFSNIGYIKSKPCTLVITYGKKVLKKVFIKTLQSVKEGPQKTVKISIPSKYASKKYTKTAIIDYYKKNKENNRKNNQFKFKF